MEQNTTLDSPIYCIDIYVNIYDIIICVNVLHTNINVVNTEIFLIYYSTYIFLVCILPRLVFSIYMLTVFLRYAIVRS